MCAHRRCVKGARYTRGAGAMENAAVPPSSSRGSIRSGAEVASCARLFHSHEVERSARGHEVRSQLVRTEVRS